MNVRFWDALCTDFPSVNCAFCVHTSSVTSQLDTCPFFFFLAFEMNRISGDHQSQNVSFNVQYAICTIEHLCVVCDSL